MPIFNKLFRRKSRESETPLDNRKSKGADDLNGNSNQIAETSISKLKVVQTKLTKHTVAPLDLIPSPRHISDVKEYSDSRKLVIISPKPKHKSSLEIQLSEDTNKTCKSVGSIKHKIYKFGERGSGFKRDEPQDFYSLRDECLDNGTLFEDPDFPPTDSSLFYSRRPDRYYEWKRPHEISDNPQFFVEGYSRFDVQQGELGDCWLLAAVANLTLYKRLFFQVVPDDQGFEEKYAGIFHFRFWQYGRWVDVVIDDRLPTYRGQLVFLHSTEDNEFWSALLEKAYAKLHGSYEALKGGSTCEAMEDFTGGVTEMYEMNASPPNLFKIVLKAFERSSLMGASLEPDPNVLEAETGEGLIRGHAYSITRVRYVDIETPNSRGKIPLLRLRNPWGNEAEWNGPWSDKSPEWRFIPEHEKQELGLTFDNDGEFWISFKDFMQHFDRLEICNLNPDSLTEEELSEGHKKRWEVSFFEGEWVRGVTAGGCRNYLETFWHNPQYRVTLTEVDDDDEEGKCTLIVALMQKNRRSQRNMGIDVLTVGFAIYHLPYPDRVSKPLDLNFFKYNASVARSPSFINLREVSCRFKLPPGTYCIVPSTFEPSEEGEFLLRIFSEHQNNMEENDAQIGMGEVDKRVRNVQPTPQINQVNDQVYEFFKKLAGEDGEVDWMELKQVLDYAMKLDGPIEKMGMKQVEGVEGGPGGQQGDFPCCQDKSMLLCIGALCCFLCMLMCKDKSNQNPQDMCGACTGGILANLCAGSLAGQMQPQRTNDNRVYNSIDNEIITAPPDPSNPPHPASYELQNKGFSKDVCRSMVAMLDSDHSGKLRFEEFKSLWHDVRDWKMAFRLYDRDNSGTLDGFELRQAFTSAGYNLNYRVLNILMHRYGNQNGQMEFDDFINCAVKLKTMLVQTGGISEDALIRAIQYDQENDNRYI
ncbi:calpain-A-like isoform X2 [Onthophagus taurus]|uniref:calpain-A-like isoform X2 n=1 Tax=Onthophagus taurus TaxID=166361 RepID=UPI0039BE5F64